MTDDICVIVRSAEERTVDLCYHLLDSVFPKKVIKICVKPFSRAVQVGYELGIDSRKKWTLIVDADVLIHNKGLQKVATFAEKQPDDVFMFFGCMVDKLMWCTRPGGVKLYRTSLLSKALKHVPAPEKAIRPEEAVILGMEKEGYKYTIIPTIAGIHDFEQEYIDLAKKGFLHSKKHQPKFPTLMPIWEKVATEDKDFAAFLIGARVGKSYEGKVIADSGTIRDIVQPFFNGFGKKRILNVEAYNQEKVSTIIKKILTHPYRVKVQKRLYKKYAIGL